MTKPTGRPKTGRPRGTYEVTVSSLFDHVDVGDGSGCWIWTGWRQKAGYGRVSFHARTQLAHRFFYELLVGPIPEGLELDHVCHTQAQGCRAGMLCPHRPCVRPEHLEPVTRKVNHRRGWANETTRERHAAITHCKRGHEFNERNTYRVLSQGVIKRSCRACKALYARERRTA